MTLPTGHAAPEPPRLHRGLSNRHVQLMAIGGTIGTGLFMGSGKSIALAGPSIVLVYLIIGMMLFLMMRALGELLLSNPAYRSFTDCCADLIGPWAGFFVGWTYWFCWVVTGTAEVIAIAGYTHFWWPTLPAWVPAFICIAGLLTLNLVHVKLFGEMEFWFAIVKIVAIVGLVVTAVVLMATGFHATNGQAASVTNLWRAGGFFPTGWSGFFAAFQIAIFAFVGIELVGTAAAETHDPKRTLPRAVNAIPIRIVIFYIGALFAIMCVTPWYAVAADRSPFVALFTMIGFPAAAGLVNFVVLSSAASSANSGIFSTSRILYGLGSQSLAPKRFGALSARGIPVQGLAFSCACLLLSAALLYLLPNLSAEFTLVTSIAALLFMFVWAMILLAYLSYRRRCPALHSASCFPMPGGRLACVAVLAFFAAVLVMLTQRSDTRQALEVTPLWFFLLALAWLVQRKGGNPSVSRNADL